MQCLSRWAGGLNTYIYMCIDRRVYDVEISVGVMRIYIYIRLCICKQLKRVDVCVWAQRAGKKTDSKALFFTQWATELATLTVLGKRAHIFDLNRACLFLTDPFPILWKIYGVLFWWNFNRDRTFLTVITSVFTCYTATVCYSN